MTEHRDCTGRRLKVGDWIVSAGRMGQIHDLLYDRGNRDDIVFQKSTPGQPATGYFCMSIYCIKIPFDTADFVAFRTSEFRPIDD